jgi:hypothetical protein
MQTSSLSASASVCGLSTANNMTAPSNSINPAITSGLSTSVSASNISNAAVTAPVEIQAQFELSVELRRFINIDLFQRGYYQVRLSVKCGNKQIPAKIILQLEENKNNNNLSGMI